jgi:protein phosphatase
MAECDKETAEFEVALDFSDKFFDASKRRLRFEFGAATHQGHVRPNNEDHYAVVRRRRTSEMIASNLPSGDIVLADESAYSIVVADGMGGPEFGELASRMVLQRMFELAQQATSWVTRLKDLDNQQIRQRVDAYVKRIQATLREQIRAAPELTGMGTTWTSAHLMSDRALVVHIGDSRAYLWHQGKLHQITRDETVAQALIDSGAEPESVSRFRHMLINSFGGETDAVKAQIHEVHIDIGDQILLCTDGLTDMVNDEGIASILQASASPQSACNNLIGAALQGGGNDNVTVVLSAAV